MAAASASPEGGQRRPLATAGAWTLLQIVGITAFTTYPFAAMVQQLSDISPTRYSPCSERNCTFLKVIGDGHVPSTLDSWRNPFKTIRNGEIPTDTMPGSFVPPLCPNMTKNQMQRLCASAGRPLPEEFATLGLASVEVVNTLRGAPSEVVYLIGIAGWYLFKVLHDCLLVLHYPEVLTLNLGIVSVVFQLVAMASSFVWCVGAAGLFMAPVADGACACYYRLGTLDTGLSIATPAALAVLAAKKEVAVMRSILSGDFLYAVQYDVPYRWVAQSAMDPIGSLLVDRHGGNVDEYTRDISLSQFRKLRLAAIWGLSFTFGLEAVYVSAALGPICVRGFEWLLTFSQEHDSRPAWFSCMVSCAIAVFVVPPLYTIYYDMTMLFDFTSMSWSKVACQMPPLLRFFNVFKYTGRGLLVSVSGFLLSKLLIEVLLQLKVPFESRQAWLVCSLASTYFFWQGSFVVTRHRYMTMMALEIRALVPLAPEDFIRMARIDEYDLREEGELARAFLARHPVPSDPEGHLQWTRLWNSELRWLDFWWATERCTCPPTEPSDESTTDDDDDDVLAGKKCRA